MHPTIKTFLVVLAFILTFFAGVGATKLASKSSTDIGETENTTVERRESGYKFINPLLECEYINSQGNTKLQAIQETVEKISQEKSHLYMSVYYRDLSNGPWYGFNEDVTFAPQSLLKLPVTISYLKLSEQDPKLLEKIILYSEKMESNLEPEEDLVLGESYTVRTLIERALTLSDNIAFNLLVENLPSETLKKTHTDLGIPYPQESTPQDFISVRAYSSIFRVLYNSSYLYRTNSEYILDILSKTSFDDGLVKQLPKEIPVAHKFGILNRGNSQRQLHDCGIIYHPQNPYVLCVMSRGQNAEELERNIQDVSKRIFEVVDKE